MLKFTGAFATPESVLYDAAADRYLVSNINGAPGEADGKILEAEDDKHRRWGRSRSARCRP